MVQSKQTTSTISIGKHPYSKNNSNFGLANSSKSAFCFNGLKDCGIDLVTENNNRNLNNILQSSHSIHF
ncbi:hypothetical protein Gasu2_00480 [Galdieria sulphuraria]|nr:hypothetical protein Gasu2_00480 [Galdieria sulphuraria]